MQIKNLFTLLAAVLSVGAANAQLPGTMNSKPNTDTYKLIESYGYGVEVPDCGHPVPHITNVYDNELGRDVFAFTLHAKLDDDRCGATDRQRTEIKTWGPSPAWMKGYRGTTQTYIWKFKIDRDFQPSPKFCHIHQIKADAGPGAGLPLVTITPCIKGGKEVMQLNTTSQEKVSKVLAEAPLADFKGVWMEVTETMLNEHNGTIETTIRRVSDNKTVLHAKSDNVDLWRDGAGFNRPKYGIYRSLLEPSYLRDETVLFADIEFINIPSGEVKSEAAPSDGKIFNARDFGLLGDGKTDETAALQRAIDHCAAQGGGTVVVPPGIYLTSTITLKPNVHIYIDKNAELVNSTPQKPLILGGDAPNTSVDGEGIIDGYDSADYMSDSKDKRKVK